MKKESDWIEEQSPAVLLATGMLFVIQRFYSWDTYMEAHTCLN